MLCDCSALCILPAGQDFPKPSELVQPWNLLRSPDQPQRGELDQVCVPTLQTEGSGKIPSSISILHSQTGDPTGWSTFLHKYYLRSSYRSTLLSGEVKSSTIYQQMALTITHRWSLLVFPKLGDLSMASRNLSCLKTEKLPRPGKSRVRQRQNPIQPGNSPTKNQTAGGQTVFQRPQEVFLRFLGRK